jgi:hypothetical protein
MQEQLHYELEQLEKVSSGCMREPMPFRVALSITTRNGNNASSSSSTFSLAAATAATTTTDNIGE